MRMNSSTSFHKKTGFIEKLTLHIYPDYLTLLPSRNASLYLMEAIQKALIKDNKRALKEKREREKLIAKTNKRKTNKKRTK